MFCLLCAPHCLVKENHCQRQWIVSLFKGIEAFAQRSIRGDSDTPNGALKFRVDVGYESFICVGKNTYRTEMIGKVVLHSGYGYTTVHFNSLNGVLESVLKTGGEEIFQYKKNLGEFKGFVLVEPAMRDNETHEAIIVAPEGRLPYKTVSREQFLRARIKSEESLKIFNNIAGLQRAIENMSPAERQSPALVSDISATPGRTKLFATETEGGVHLVTIDRSFFDPKLPRDAIQFITVRWHWSDQYPPKTEAIQAFKQNFDFAALRQMLGR